jgi:hypothetical protein
MKTILITLTLMFAATLANGQFSCTPKVPSDICKAAESGNMILAKAQKGLTVVVADPASFALEESQLEAVAKVRCEAAWKTGNPKTINRCRGQAAYGIASDVLLETSEDGSLQKVVISTDFFRAADNTKTKFIKQPDGSSKVEMAYGEPDPLTTFEKMTQVGFFVLGYNSGRLNYMVDNL